jgi:hypothetical protein
MIDHIKQKLPRPSCIAGQRRHARGGDRPRELGRRRHQGRHRPGKVCITRLKTGFGTGGWQLSALKWCARVATKPIIADGGIRDHGDIAKSVRFGARMVMIGSLFAGHEESPGQTVEVDGKLYKEYYGSASRLQQGRVQARRGQAHPRADQGQAGRHAARDARGRAELDLVFGRHPARRHPQGQLRHPGRRQRGRAPADVGGRTTCLGGWLRSPDRGSSRQEQTLKTMALGSAAMGVGIGLAALWAMRNAIIHGGMARLREAWWRLTARDAFSATSAYALDWTRNQGHQDRVTYFMKPLHCNARTGDSVMLVRYPAGEMNPIHRHRSATACTCCKARW